MKFVASSPITSRQIDVETIEIVTDFIFLGSKITADGDAIIKLKDLAPWMEKAMTTHSSVLSWRIPGMAEPGGLLSTGSHRVGHD